MTDKKRMTIRQFCKKHIEIIVTIGVLFTIIGVIYAVLTFHLFSPSTPQKETQTTATNPRSDEDNKNPVKRDIHQSKHIQKPPIDNKKEISEKEQKPSQSSINANNSVVVTGKVNGNINNTVNEFPEPKFDSKELKINSPESDIFKTEILLTIDSKTALKNLRIVAKAPSILSLKAEAQRTGISMIGLTGKRDGFAYTNIPSAWGQYILIIISQKPEKYEINYEYE